MRYQWFALVVLLHLLPATTGACGICIRLTRDARVVGAENTPTGDIFILLEVVLDDEEEEEEEASSKGVKSKDA